MPPRQGVVLMTAGALVVGTHDEHSVNILAAIPAIRAGLVPSTSI